MSKRKTSICELKIVTSKLSKYKQITLSEILEMWTENATLNSTGIAKYAFLKFSKLKLRQKYEKNLCDIDHHIWQ